MAMKKNLSHIAYGNKPFNPDMYRTQSDLSASVVIAQKRLVAAIDNLPYFFALLDVKMSGPKSEHVKMLVRSYISKRLESTQTSSLGPSLWIGQDALRLHAQIDELYPNFWDALVDIDIEQLDDTVILQAEKYHDFESQATSLRKRIEDKIHQLIPPKES